MRGLYIHVPFCGRKCPYCDFYSAGFSNKSADLYLNAVVRNIRHYAEKYGKIHFDTVYCGGGTPSLITADKWQMIFSAAQECFDIAENAEISIEVNPGMSSEKRFSELKKAGFNRISFGVQSLKENELKALGRLHTPKMAIDAVKAAASAGFDDISADIMLGVPYQTSETLAYTLEHLVQLPLTHISAYMLKIEENTPFNNDDIRKLIADDDSSADLYLNACEYLESNGFKQYEISNFAKNGKISRHNMLYWSSEEYLGIGPSAHSYFNGKRSKIAADNDIFFKNEFQQEEITQNYPDGISDKIMVGLRLVRGVDVDRIFGYEQREKSDFIRKAEFLQKHGFLRINGKNISLTRKGFLVSNELISILLP